MPLRKIAIRSPSSFLGFAGAGGPAAGATCRVSLRCLVLHGLLWAVVGSGAAVLPSAEAEDLVVNSDTTIIDSDQTYDNTYVAPNTEDTATLEVTTGGALTNIDDLYVGSGGTGTLNVTGGSVTNSNSYIGYSTDSVGTATVSSGTWANSGNLCVGFGGNGTLNVTGGSVTNSEGYLGHTNNSVGTVTVSGGTWATSGNLKIGNYYDDSDYPEDFAIATGELTMTGGLVTVSGILSRDTYNATSLGTINLNAGGTLQIGTGGAGSRIEVGNLSNNGTLAFNQSDNYTYSDAISGSGAVTKAGAGTLTLSAANTYTGLTTISGGSLAYGTNNALGTGGVTVNGGVLNLSSYSDTVGAVTLTSGTIAGTGTLTSSSGFTMDGTGLASARLSGAVGLTKSGPGTVTTLTGSNTYTGGTTISGGTLQIGAGSTTGSIAGNVVNNGTLAFNRSDSLIYSGTISGSGGLTKLGSGLLQLSGSNSYTGVTTINSGTLQINTPNGSIAASGTITFGGGALVPNVNVDYSSKIKNSSGAIAFGSNGGFLFASSLDSSNTGGLTKIGSGTLTLSASNAYTGRTQINAGTLALSNSNALAGSGTISFGGGTLQYSGSNTVDYSSKILSSGSAISINTNLQNVNFASGLDSSNTGGLTKLGSGTLTLSGSNGFTGDVNLYGAVGVRSTLELNNANALAGGGNINIYSAGYTPVLKFSANNATDYSARIKASDAIGSLIVDTNGQSVTFSGLTSLRGFEKTGSGTLTLSGSSSVPDVRVSAGTVRLGTATVLSGSVAVQGGTLDIGNTNPSVAYVSAYLTSSIIGTGTLTCTGSTGYILRGSSVTVAANLGTGTMSVYAVSGTTTTTVNLNGTADVDTVFMAKLPDTPASSLILGSEGRFTNNQVAITGSASNGTLVLGGNESVGSIAGPFNIALGSAALTTGNNNSSTSFSGILSGTGGSLVKQGTGTLTLSGSSSYTGGTTIAAGTLKVADSNALGTGNLAVNAGTFDLNGRSVAIAALSGSSGGVITSSTTGAVTLIGSSASDSTFAGAIQNGSGTVALVKQGAGKLTLTGSNSYSGGTTLTAGTLALGHANALGSSGTISFGGGTLQYSASNTADYSARFSSAASQQYRVDTNGQNITLASNLTSSGGSFEKLGTGAVTLSGANTYSGGTTVTAGSLVGTTSSLQGAIVNNAAVTFDQSTAGTYSGVMSGSGSFTKLGTGAVTLSGANTYSGPTTVSAGSLLVNGSLTNSAVTVDTGGTLGGSGTLGRVTVQSGGVLSPGNSPGALAAAALDLQAESTTFMQVIGSGSAAGVAGTAYDQVRITPSGGLTYGGSLNLNFGNTTTFLNGTIFDLFAFTGSSVGHFSSVVSTGTGSYAGSSFSRTGGIWTTTIGVQLLTFSELSGRLSFARSGGSAVPEIDPATGSSALSLIAGVLAIFEQRRRRFAATRA